jgi:plasmid stability protein
LATLKIRDLDRAVEEGLRLRAARNRRSLEAEVHAILAAAVAEEHPSADVFAALAERLGRRGEAPPD